MATEPSPRDDWAAQLTGKVEQAVSLIRDRTVRPVQHAVRLIIFGILAFAIVGVTVVLGSIFLVRLLDNLLFHQNVWASDLLLGGIFWLAGLLVYSQRHSRA
jgi:hypothetical protein